jgi:hypothetical protein
MTFITSKLMGFAIHARSISRAGPLLLVIAGQEASTARGDRWSARTGKDVLRGP